ncbi:hypothetical protein ABPG72_019406 [Tetrahymena utriculariae]
MFDDQCYIHKDYLQQRNQGNNDSNSHVTISFSKNVENEIQIEQLLQCFEFGNINNNGAIDLFGDQEEPEEILIPTNELLTGKSLKSLTLNLTRQYLGDKNMKELSKFTKLCPNLICFGINLNENNYLNMSHACNLFANLTELKQLQQLKFEMKYKTFAQESILQIAEHASHIPNLILFSLVIDLSDLNCEGWKGFYQQLSNLKKLNTLIVENQGYIKQDKPLKLIAKRNYKKILRLVSKNIISDKLERIHVDDDDYEFDQVSGLF